MGANKGKKKEKKPTTFANNFERLLYEKPAFKALYERMQQKRMQNELNIIVDYVNDKKYAETLYSGNDKWKSCVAEIEEALNAKVKQVITSGKIYFAGFPANMGEAAVKMTFEAFGTLKDVTCETSEDGMTLEGRAEFEEKDA